MKTLPEGAYGLLLAFDGYEASSDHCADEALLRSVLIGLPARIGMRRLGEPQIVSVDEPGIAGLSGFTFIMESHISIHTYAERGFVTADVYSCKWFDLGEATRYLAEAFSIPSFDTSHVVRGLRFGALPEGSGTPMRP